jgi:hypothetical protein
MRSPMVENTPYYDNFKKAQYSELQVLRSAAGWYVGTTYTNEDGRWVGPGSRDSGYFATEAEAQAFLNALEAGDEEALSQLRLEP